MDVCLVEVPYHAGDDSHPSSGGAQRLIQAGAAERFAERGLAGSIERACRKTAFRDTASSSAEVNRQLAAIVRRAVASAQLPVVLAGSCNASLGVLAGFEHARCGAVWLDAHADFNTPDSTESGFFAGPRYLKNSRRRAHASSRSRPTRRDTFRQAIDQYGIRTPMIADDDRNMSPRSTWCLRSSGGSSAADPVDAQTRSLCKPADSTARLRSQLYGADDAEKLRGWSS